MKPGWAAAGAALLLLTACGAPRPGAGAETADRGIGGTGAPAGAATIADRGIGGTGIVGTITGFGSIWVNGLEIGTVQAHVESDSGAGTLAIGQVVAVQASGPEGALQAQSVAIRHEVAGPVTSVAPDGTAEVAGQRVNLATVPGAGDARPGSWVAVSGFRTPDGAIAATRVDAGAPGTVLVRGPVVARGGGLYIGDLRLGAAAPGVTAGTVATVRGAYNAGALRIERAAPDLLAANPSAYFGPHLQRLVIEGYGRAAGAQLPGAAGVPPGRTIVTLDRMPGGGFAPVRTAPAARLGEPARAAPSFAPAPVPNARAMQGGRAGRFGGTGDRPAGSVQARAVRPADRRGRGDCRPAARLRRCARRRTPMPAYLLANIQVTDQAKYDEYRAQVPAVISQYGGRFLGTRRRSDAARGRPRPQPRGDRRIRRHGGAAPLLRQPGIRPAHRAPPVGDDRNARFRRRRGVRQGPVGRTIPPPAPARRGPPGDAGP